MARSVRRGLVTLVAIAAVVVGVVVLVVIATEETTENGQDTSSQTSTVTDETGSISVDLPRGWTDRRITPFGSDAESTIPRIEAAPDLLEYRESIDAPGLEFLFAEALDLEQSDRLLDEVVDRSRAERECTAGDGEPFRDRGFEGEVRRFDACGDAGTTLWVVVASPAGEQGLVVLAVQAATAAERDLILKSFEVVG